VTRKRTVCEFRAPNSICCAHRTHNVIFSFCVRNLVFLLQISHLDKNIITVKDEIAVLVSIFLIYVHTFCEQTVYLYIMLHCIVNE